MTKQHKPKTSASNHSRQRKRCDELTGYSNNYHDLLYYRSLGKHYHGVPNYY